jgi:hypothetical protein
MAKNDVRHYLKGFNIKPHPKGGVILSATNGHALVTIHDELGFSDAEYTMPLTKRFVSAAKMKGSLLSGSVLCDGSQMLITQHATDKKDEFDLNEKTVIYCEFINQIDGKYPDFGELFSKTDLKPTSNLCINPKLIGLLRHCSDDTRSPSAKIYFSGSSGCVVAVSGMKNQYCIVINPMRYDDIDDPFVVPSHVKELIKLSSKRKLEEAKQIKQHEEAKKLEEAV